MTVIATDTSRLTNLVKRELWPEAGFCRKEVIANESAARTYAIGTVLGRVTATGKLRAAVETATDGSKVPVAVVLDDYSIASNVDAKVVAFVKGPLFLSVGALQLDASYDNVAKREIAYAALDALNINLMPTA